MGLVAFILSEFNLPFVGDLLYKIVWGQLKYFELITNFFSRFEAFYFDIESVSLRTFLMWLFLIISFLFIFLLDNNKSEYEYYFKI
ncbi:MAG TPA: hypothetical protein ENN64_01040 [bacterium]|nr:hypothetical protein [bacterium]